MARVDSMHILIGPHNYGKSTKKACTDLLSLCGADGEAPPAESRSAKEIQTTSPHREFETAPTVWLPSLPRFLGASAQGHDRDVHASVILAPLWGHELADGCSPEVYAGHVIILRGALFVLWCVMTYLSIGPRKRHALGLLCAFTLALCVFVSFLFLW